MTTPTDHTCIRCGRSIDRICAECEHSILPMIERLVLSIKGASTQPRTKAMKRVHGYADHILREIEKRKMK